MTGLDTGFFFRLVAGIDDVVSLFERIIRNEEDAAVSTVTLYELMRHGLRGSFPRATAEQLVADAAEAFRVAGTDDMAVLWRAASLSNGTGLSMADSLIAASLEHAGCSSIYTTDGDFDRYDGPMGVMKI